MTPAPWNAGDPFSIFAAVGVLAFRMVLRPAHRNVQGTVAALGAGASIGPLLLFVMDPIVQLAGFNVSLVRIAVEEGRITLWVGSFVATIYILRELF